MGTKWFIVLILVLASGLIVTGAQQDVLQDVVIEEPVKPAATSGDCSFLSNPDEYQPDAETRYALRSDSTRRVSSYVAMFAAADAVPQTAADSPTTIPRKNFIDDAIFSRIATAGIQSAPIASDAEFLRRVMLDLTGRIPSLDDVNAFLADTNPSKRDLKVDELIATPEFIDKWTMFFGDLFKVNAQASNVNRELNGRDAFYRYIKDSLSANKPYDEMARELITAAGDSFETGVANWPIGNTVTMGPAQDTYDGQAVNLSTMFMGINATDCLLCHDGARHLDQVNLWGSKQTRQNMWGLSAYFARVRMQRQVVSTTPNLAKYIVSDAATGDYQLNTTTGNRTARQPIGAVRTITPHNPFGSVTGTGSAATENYRQAVARQITGDLQFSRAAVNYIWEKFMVEAFVSPSNSFDLSRLDAANPPPAPWTLQPTNPQLLDSLARWFQQNRYDLRALMALITKSSAYQLSATYPGTWSISYVPYYARKYVRRLDAEELHDAIAKATGLIPTYTFTTLPSVQWAMQFPDSREPRSNGAVAQFLNSFGRGDRDTTFRRSDGTVLQELNMMNNSFVMSRIHQGNQGSRVAALLAQTADAQTIIRYLFMYTLSRHATSAELALFTPSFQQLGNRVAAENLQWVLLNKLDFIFNY